MQVSYLWVGPKGMSLFQSSLLFHTGVPTEINDHKNQHETGWYESISMHLGKNTR